MDDFVVLGIIAIVVVLFIFLAVGKYMPPKFTNVKIGNATVHAELADNQFKQVRGLMFRDSLPKDGGMLFVFQGEQKHGIWMMNMSMPLDIVWLGADKKVVHIEQNVQPCDALLFCPAYFPESKDRYVLEVAAGYVKKHDISLGSAASFNLARLL